MFTLIFLDFVLWCVFCTLCVSYEKGWFAFWLTVLAGGVAWILGYNIPGMIWNDPMLLVKYGSIYIAIGAVWAAFKFIWKLRKARSRYLKDKHEWMNKIGEFVDKHYPQPRTDEDWIEYCKERVYDYRSKYAPTVAQNKENILFWATWWPFSVLSFFIADFLVNIWEVVWKMMRGTLENIRTAALGEAAKDLDDK